MQNVRMTVRRLRLGSVLLAGVLLVSACGADPEVEGQGSPTPTGTGTATGSETPGESTSGEDDGLTEPGTELQLGQPATFEWRPTQRLSGTLEVSVDRIEQTTMEQFSGFKLTRDLRRSTPYFVQVSARNVGEANLGGHDLPLFLDNGSDVLQPSAEVTSAFPPCPSRPLPKNFRQGKRTELCLVFLAPDGSELSSIVLRPTEEFLPITWTGEVTTAKDGKRKRGKGKKKR